MNRAMEPRTAETISPDQARYLRALRGGTKPPALQLFWYADLLNRKLIMHNGFRGIMATQTGRDALDHHDSSSLR